MAPQDILYGHRHRCIRDQVGFHLGARVDQAGNDAAKGSGAFVGQRNFGRCCFGFGNQVLHRGNGRICPHQHTKGALGNKGHGHKIFGGVIGHGFEQKFVGDQSCRGGKVKRIPVRRRAGSSLSPNDVLAAGFVFNHDGLTQGFTQTIAQQTRHVVRTRTRGLRQNELHRLVWPIGTGWLSAGNPKRCPVE